MLGVYFLDLVCRKAGDEGLKRLTKPRLLKYMKARMEKHAAMVLVISCIGFALVGWAAIAFGRGILRIVNSSEFLWAMWIFIAICVVGSALSVIQWILNARHR